MIYSTYTRSRCTSLPQFGQITLIFLLILLSQRAVVAGGGWTQPQGSGFFKLGQNILIAGRYFQPNGEIVNIPTISLYTTSLYAEYGLTDRLTTVVYFPFFVRSTLNRTELASGREVEPGDFVNSVGDADVGFKYGLITDGPVVVSAGITLGLPLGETAGGNTNILQTGDGEFNQLITLEASHGFGKVPLYATALLGFNNRTKNFSEEFRYGLEVGYSFSKITAQLRLYGVESFKNGDARGGAGNTVFANDTEYLSITPEVAYNLSRKTGITASAGFAAFGSKILASPNYGVGVFWKL